MKKLPVLVGALGLVLAQAVQARADDSGPPAPQPERHHTAAPWILAGVGAGVAAIGALSFVGAAKANDDAQTEANEKGCSTSPQVVCPAGVDATHLQTNVDGEHAMNVIGVVMAAAGGTALITGLVWHFLEPTGARRAALVLTPTVAPTFAGISLAARF